MAARQLQLRVIEDLTAARRQASGVPDSLRADVLDLAQRCEELLFYRLAVRDVKGSQWAVLPLLALAGASEYLRGIAERPRIFGDVGCLVQAAWLLGKADALVRAKRDRDPPGRPVGRGASQTPLILKVAATLGRGATRAEIADQVQALGGKAVSEQAVGQALRRAKAK